MNKGTSSIRPQSGLLVNTVPCVCKGFDISLRLSLSQGWGGGVWFRFPCTPSAFPCSNFEWLCPNSVSPGVFPGGVEAGPFWLLSGRVRAPGTGFCFPEVKRTCQADVPSFFSFDGSMEVTLFFRLSVRL